MFAILFALAGCNSETFGKQLPPYRYKLTAQVETPEGLKSGSSVIEVQWKLPPKIMGTQGSGSFQMTGQAVTVDLPRGQTLYVLLRSDWDGEWASRSPYGPHRSLPAGIRDRRAYPVERTRRTFGRDVSNYPLFVRFRDDRDPHTVEEVDPDNLAASFGRGVRLSALTVQLTDEPVVLDIRKRLPWLDDLSIGFYEPPKDPTTGRPVAVNVTELEHRLTYQDFLRD